MTLICLALVKETKDKLCEIINQKLGVLVGAEVPNPEGGRTLS